MQAQHIATRINHASHELQEAKEEIAYISEKFSDPALAESVRTSLELAIERTLSRIEGALKMLREI